MGWCIGCQRKWSARSGWGIGSGGMLIGGRRLYPAPPNIWLPERSGLFFGFGLRVLVSAEGDI